MAISPEARLLDAGPQRRLLQTRHLLRQPLRPLQQLQELLLLAATLS